MKEAVGVSDELMLEKESEVEVPTSVSKLEATSETTEIDGYRIIYKEPTPIIWTTLSSNSWRTRLKRAKNNPFVHATSTPDELLSSAGSRRYKYAYPSRFRYPSPEIIPSVLPQDLLEIAGSAAQAFKDVLATMKEREETRRSSSSKKGKRLSTEPAQDLKISAAGDRSDNSDDEPLAKQMVAKKKGRTRKESLEEPKEKSRKKKEEVTPVVAKKIAKEDKKKKSRTKSPSSPLKKENSDAGSSPQRCASPSLECTSSFHGSVLETPKSYEEKISSSVNIKGWSNEQIFEHFNLKDFIIDISDFPLHELQPSTSAEPMQEKSPKKSADVELESKQNQNETKEVKQSEADRRVQQMDVEEQKSRKRKRSASSSSSCSCVSSAGGGKNSDSDSEQNVPAKGTAKKKAHSERPCVECGRWLDDCTYDWKDILGASSVWCSRDCIERRVAKAHEVLPESYGALTMLRSDGQLLTTGPTLVNLAEFIYKYPEYEPVLPVAKKKAKNDQNVDAKKSSPKVLSKDSDRVRFNVKRAFADALMKRAKMDKVKSAIKLCKDVSENIEAALFKSCHSNLNSPRYKTWTKAFIANVTDCRNKHFYHKVLTGVISVQKVVTLEKEDMRKPEYSSANVANCEEDKAPESNDGEDVARNDAIESNADVEIIDDPKKNGSEIVSGSSVSVSETTRSSRSAVKKDTSATSGSKKKTEPKPSKRVSQKVSKTSTTRSNSALDSILGDGARDTTEQHLSHFYDVNCSICLAKQKSQAEAERKEREEKEKQRLEEKRFREMLSLEKCIAYTSKENLSNVDIDYRKIPEKSSYDEDESEKRQQPHFVTQSAISHTKILHKHGELP